RDGVPLPPSIYDLAYVDRSMTHLAPTWNISPRFGVSLSLPVIYEKYYLYQRTGLGIITRSGHDYGIGDLSLIGRFTALNFQKGKPAMEINLLGGVKLPPGNPFRLNQEVQSTRDLDATYGPGH